MEALKLSADMQALLTDLGNYSRCLSVYGLDPEEAELAVWEVARPMLDALGLPLVYRNQCRWFLRELASIFRTLRGKYLVFAIEPLITKWVGYNLKPNLLEVLIGCCVESLPAGEEFNTKNTKADSKTPNGQDECRAQGT